MDRKSIIDGLKMTRDLCVFDPSTGEEIESHLLNDINRATYDACKGALEILEQLDTDSDTISRQAAIDDIWTVSPIAKLDREWIDRWLRQLPSALLTIDADGTLWITVSDIEQVKRVIVDEEKSKFCRQFWMDGDGPASCEDAVSRKAVQCLLAYFVDEDKYVDACDGLKHLPPVTPKQRTGKWIPVGVVDVVGGESAMWGSAIAYHKCSECDEQALKDDFDEEVLSKWCPHCGAKMEGDAE